MSEVRSNRAADRLKGNPQAGYVKAYRLVPILNTLTMTGPSSRLKAQNGTVSKDEAQKSSNDGHPRCRTTKGTKQCK